MFFFLIIVCSSKNKHSFKFFLWFPGVVDFKMLKRKLLVKTLNEKCKALKGIEKGLPNKDASRSKIKKSSSKLWKTIVPAKNEN